MANITLSGILLDPTSEFAVGDEVRFTHNSTTGETIKSAISTLTIPPDGSYSIDLQYGLVLVEYKDIRSSQFKNLGVATVNADNPAASIPELLNALVPVSNSQLIEFQAILADCVAAQLAAESAADISEAFANQLTTAGLIASTSTYTATVTLLTSGFDNSGDGFDGSWKQNGLTGQTPSQTPIQLGGAILNDGLGNQWALVEGQVQTYKNNLFYPGSFGSQGVGVYVFLNNYWSLLITNSKYSDPKKNKLELIAHRGFLSSATQNTMQAFTTAISSGADSLECDVQISSDGIPVVFHDPTVDSLTNGSGSVSALTLAQLQALKYTATIGTIVEGTKIPTFLDVLIYCKQAGVKLYPEIKGYRTQADIQLMVDDIYEAGMERQVYMQSFSISDLEYTRGLDSVVNLGFLSGETNPVIYEPAIDSVAALGDGFIYWSYSALISTPAIIAYAKSKNLDVAAWTVNSNDDAKTLMGLGVNKLMSNIQLRVL